MSGPSGVCKGNGCCCSSRTALTITAVIGAAILVFGVLSILSLNSGQLGSLRHLMMKAAQGIGTSPSLLPIVITATGGAVLLASLLICARARCCASTSGIV